MTQLNIARNALFILILLSFAGVGYADVVELKNGTVVDGTYMGGTQSSVRFQVSGELKVFSKADILAITFTSLSTSPKATAAVVSAPVVSEPNRKTIPSGTVLLVKISEDITTQNKKSGAKFAAVLQNKLIVSGVEVAPAGATVYGQVLKSQKGGIGSRRALLEITLTQILVDGALKEIKTSVLTGEGEKGGLGRKILKGAAIGALADGNSGAEDGAKIGAGIGILAGGKHAGLAQGEVIEFILTEALPL